MTNICEHAHRDAAYAPVATLPRQVVKTIISDFIHMKGNELAIYQYCVDEDEVIVLNAFFSNYYC